MDASMLERRLWIEVMAEKVMEECKVTITDAAIRTALQNLGDGGKEVAHFLIYEALGLGEAGECFSEKDVVPSRVNDMTRYCEVIRTERGKFVYDFKHRVRNADPQEIWRFVRPAKPDLTITKCSLMTHASYCYGLRLWLKAGGHLP